MVTPQPATAAPAKPTTTTPATPPPAAPTSRRRIGPHAEVAVVTMVLLLLGIATGDWFTFVALAPSPLLLPVLWGALRGGLAPALSATVIVGALHTLGVVALAGQDLAVLTDERVTWPLFAFAAIAFLVGQSRDFLAGQIAALRATRERLRAETARQRHDIEVLEHANRELKRRIFDRSFDLDSLVATVARSAIDDSEHMFEVPLGMLVDFCGATKCSALLVLPDGKLDLAAHRGWTEEEIGPRLLLANNNTRVLRAIVEAPPIVEMADGDADAAGPLLIAPIADATGVIKALVCIDELPPTRFEESTIKTFLGIVSWLATNLRRIQLREATGEGKQQMLSALDKQKHIGTVADLAERIHLEDARRKRYGVETELVAIRLLDVRVNMAEYIESLETWLLNALNAAVRLTDDIFSFGFAGCYVLALTGTKPGNGDKVVARIQSRFDASKSMDLGPVEIRHFATTTEAPTLTDLLPVLTEHFCGQSPVPLAQQCPVPEPRAQRSGNAQEFARRLRLETDLAKRFGTELNMIDFRRDDGGFGVGPMIARHLWNSVGTLLRVTDGIYVVNPNRCVVLLPFTSCLDASRIWARLDESLRKTLPSDYYADVRVDFLALDAEDLRRTVQYFVGDGDGGDEPPPGALVTDSELQELAFSDAEFAGLRTVDADLEKAFRVLATNGVDMPPLPSAEAVTKRWEEVFEGGDEVAATSAAPVVQAGPHVAIEPSAPSAVAASAPIAEPAPNEPPAANVPFGDQTTMRLLLSQIEGLRALCLRLTGRATDHDEESKS